MSARARIAAFVGALVLLFGGAALAGGAIERLGAQVRQLAVAFPVPGASV